MKIPSRLLPEEKPHTRQAQLLSEEKSRGSLGTILPGSAEVLDASRRTARALMRSGLLLVVLLLFQSTEDRVQRIRLLRILRTLGSAGFLLLLAARRAFQKISQARRLAPFVAKHRSQDSGSKLSGIARGWQQVLQLHLSHGLCVRQNTGIRHGSGHQDGQNQLALAIRERGVEEAADLRAADTLAETATQNGGHPEIQTLIHQINRTCGGKRPWLDCRSEVISCGNTVPNMQCPCDLLQIRERVGSTSA